MSLSRGAVSSLSKDAGKVLGYRQEAQTKPSPSLWNPTQSQTPDCSSHQPVTAYPRLASHSRLWEMALQASKPSGCCTLIKLGHCGQTDTSAPWAVSYAEQTWKPLSYSCRDTDKKGSNEMPSVCRGGTRKFSHRAWRGQSVAPGPGVPPLPVASGGTHHPDEFLPKACDFDIPLVPVVPWLPTWTQESGEG